ncbi:penicillin-binding transpeptidase domain-containing protein [Halobacillus seohaensis]|uniref:serine-type D-Ala-D-Ala carboxypeptidase n=1 Tax=Halobacillus seohaensis TaxID=447421 RepID=A0ABW2EGP9_9BACI
MKQLMMFIFLSAFIVLVGCSDQPRPETTVEAYMEAWESEEFTNMYNLLSESSQNVITQEEFEKRYTAIYDGISMANLAVTYNLPDEKKDYDEEDSPSYDYEVSMETLAGDLNFSHTAELVFEDNDEGGEWAILWDSSMIFSGMEEGDTIRAQPLAAERGEILDENGQALAENGVVQQVGLVPDWMEDDKEEVKKELADILGLSIEYINEKMEQSWVKASSFVPLSSIANDDEERIEKIKKLNGTKFQQKSARIYPLGESAAHLTGYVDAITAEQLEEKSGEGYTATDQLGQTGLERILENDLKGEAGGKVAILDEADNEKEVLAEKEPRDGKDVTLTINSDIQQAIYSEMDGDAGSSAAINPSTGQVKALVSSPAYDPNEFVLGMNSERRSELQEDPERPLLNKFTSNSSPGSTFKPITAAIGLETGDIDPSEEMSIPDKTFTKKGWGDYSVTRVDSANVDQSVNLRDALVRSDNIYFARSILSIGDGKFLQKAKDFGFSEEIPFPYPISSSQIINEGEFGDHEVLLADTGYGQGQVQMSTLHLAIAYTPFITDGDLLQPTLYKDEEPGQLWQDDVISEGTAVTIRENLKAVVEDSEGSGYEPPLEGINLAGKTGTAELKQSLEDENGQENGWFIAWDTDQKDLLVSMTIEDVDEGSSYVVPKVKNVFDQLR